MRRGRWIRLAVLLAAVVSLFAVAIPVAANPDNGRGAPTVRFATFNASMSKNFTGDLITALQGVNDPTAKATAEIIQRTQPDVVLINEFDYDEEDGGASEAGRLFQENYLGVVQAAGVDPIVYPHRIAFESNTGVHSSTAPTAPPLGFDFNNDGMRNPVSSPFNFVYANDSFGFGWFPGQFGFIVYSKFPILEEDIRTFQNFLWQDMPGALLPFDPATGDQWYDPDELDVFRLSSKSHVDIPLQVEKQVVHFLVSHPTPPVFDDFGVPPGVDYNGKRNHDEIRFWADYVGPGKNRGSYIVDDDGDAGGLKPGSLFVIAGDQNSDPNDGDSVEGSAQLLLDNPAVNSKVTPTSPGGVEAADPGHGGHPAHDTADFGDPPGNLRVDYVLPSKSLQIRDAGIFWPVEADPLSALVTESDHRLVWVDVSHGGFPNG